MNEIINSGLMKEGSLSAKIYFLLLNKSLTQTEISKNIYSGKVQLDNIKKNLDDLEKVGFVKKNPRDYGIGENYNRIFYSATFKPLEDFMIKQVKWRKKASKSKKKELLTKNDLNFIKLFLNSQWFKRFYSQKFMNLDLECEGKINRRFCSCPIRFMARLLEEIFVISETFGNYHILFNKEEITITNFDKFISDNSFRIEDHHKRIIEKIVQSAKEGLGDYDRTNSTIDFYFHDYGVLFLPHSLSRKLSSIGRVPLTVAIYFNSAIRDSLGI
ncbi:MAG: hypothetical protein AABX66_02610 [Nanoarchaeota archaeon]